MLIILITIHPIGQVYGIGGINNNFNTMQFSQTYVATIVALLAFFLPKLGVTVGSDELTSIIQGLVVAVSGIWVLVRRYRAGGVNVIGKRV